MKRIVFFSMTFAMTVCAAEKDAEPEAFLNRASAGQDYVDQGEYLNDWGGAHVIALGKGDFRMVTYRGGLPGDGWDGDYRQETSGRRMEGKIVFTDDGYRAELAEGKITITNDSGGPYTMEKTVRRSSTLGAKPPSGAVVLFDGSNADAWVGGHLDDRNFLATGSNSKQSFQDFSVHLEFLLPFKPLGRGQGRGNSGVYLQDRYEVQVLDSFGLTGENNECGGIYNQAKPSVNMCFPPLTWQTYDIEFKTAKFDESGNKTENAVATIKHNGVTIHDRLALKRPTGGGKKEDSNGGSLQLQGHGNPVFYRNIWVVPE